LRLTSASQHGFLSAFMSSGKDQAAAQLQLASQGFDFLFANEIADARKVFEAGINGTQDSSFHLLGLGVLTFLEAALGMEVCASKVLLT
jgi:hypothetical protein